MIWLGRTRRMGARRRRRSDERARSTPLGTPPISLSATRFWGGGLVGVAVGFRHVHVAMELDASYATVTGEYNDTHARVQGVTLAPAAALWWLF